MIVTARNGSVSGTFFQCNPGLRGPVDPPPSHAGSPRRPFLPDLGVGVYPQLGRGLWVGAYPVLGRGLWVGVYPNLG